MTCQDGGPAEVPVGPPGWAATAVGYQIFVRSFKDSDGDGVGDLKGLTASLDYLNDGQPGGSDLGVDLLWLTPIYPSPSYHGYDVTDYQAVHPELGTQEDFRALADAAHARGMRIILDLVINHSSDRHPWFTDPDKKPWYVWRNDNPGWRQPWGSQAPAWHAQGDEFYYGLFWSGMPDLNFRTDPVLQACRQIVKFWVGQGADGFRVDAARYLVEDPDGTLFETAGTHQVARSLKRWLRREKSDGLLVAEAWTRTETVAGYAGKNDEYDLAFNFDLAEMLPVVLQAEDPQELERLMTRVETSFTRRGFDAPFFENHDRDRLRTTLRGQADPLRPAAVLLLTLPGTPFLYYGQEIGMLNAESCQGDICRRAPLAWQSGAGAGFTTGTPWTAPATDSQQVNIAAQRDDPGSLLALYRDLIRLRGEYPALTSDHRRQLTTDLGAVLATLRGQGEHPVLVVINFSSEPQLATVDLSLVGQPGAVLSGTNLLSSDTLQIPAERTRFLLPELAPFGFLLLGF